MMVKTVHGHEVIALIARSGRSYSREALVEEIHRAFGASTRYETCSADNLSADELIDFLEARGKFVKSDDGFRIGAPACNH